MLNEFIYYLKNIFNYIKHFTYKFLEIILTHKIYSKGLIFCLCIIIFYLLYSLFKYLFSKIKLNSNSSFNFSDSKYNLLLQLFFLVIGSIVFFLFIKRLDNTNNITDIDTKYSSHFKDIFKNENNFYDFDKVKFKQKINNPLKTLFYISSFIFLVGLLAVFIGCLLLFIFNLFKNSTNVLFLIILTSLIITGLSIVAFIFKISLKDNTCNNINQSNFLKKIGCIIFNLIFFIPCLLIILAEFIKKEINSTQPSIIFVFILQILFILFIYLLPSIGNLFNNNNSNRLLKHNEILYLNEYKEIINFFHLNKRFHNVKINKLLDDNSRFNLSLKRGMDERDYKYKNKYDYNYIIEFELYINPQGRNTSPAYNREAVLFDYGKKPIILYDGRIQELIIKSKNLSNDSSQLDTIIRLKPNSFDANKHYNFQKWNKFEIKYYNFTIEVKLNDQIIAVQKNIPLFSRYDKIEIGEEHGIHGGIKNILYKSFDKHDWDNITTSNFAPMDNAIIAKKNPIELMKDANFK